MREHDWTRTSDDTWRCRACGSGEVSLSVPERDGSYVAVQITAIGFSGLIRAPTSLDPDCDAVIVRIILDS